MARSVKMAYFLWAVGGPLLGLHHLYLGRDYQWFLWISSCSAAAAGWIVDAWRMPAYVAQANQYKQHPNFLTGWQSRKGKKVWDIQLIRWVGSYVFAYYYEMTCVYALKALAAKSGFVLLALLLLKSLLRGAAVFLCFSIGEKHTALRWVVFASVSSELILRGVMWLIWPWRALEFLSDSSWPSLLVQLILFLTTAIVAFGMQSFRQELRAPRHLCLRFPLWLVAACFWIALFFLAIYQHLEIPISSSSSDSNFASTRMLKDVVQEIRSSESYKYIFDKICASWLGFVGSVRLETECPSAPVCPGGSSDELCVALDPFEWK
eukprot:Polyplicarium_translucidae@DN2209_c0_g1_i2.p1